MRIGDDTENARSRYRRLRHSHPELFTNQRGGFEIVFDDAEMDAAELAAWQRFCAERDADKALADATPFASRAWFRVGVVFEDAYLIILRDAVRTPTGDLVTYFRIYNRLDKGPGAAMLARLNGKIILLRHHRHALRAFINEMPRGFGRPGETAEDTAVRQIREELATEVHALTELGEIHPDGGKLGDAVGVLLVDVPSVGGVERGEAIADYELIDEGELTRRIANDEIKDAFTLSLYAKAVAKKYIRIP